MASGWGAMGGGAWGAPTTTPVVHDPDLDSDDGAPQQPKPSNAGLAPLYSEQPVAPSNNGYAGAFQPSTSFAPAAPVASGSGDQASRAAALSKREKELEAKELRLKELEDELRLAGGFQKKNWPICWPIIYHDIAGEIPEKSRRVVREMYFCWWGLFFCLWYNFFCGSVILGVKADDSVPSWFLTVVYLICGIPISFFTWYRSIYNAAKNQSQMRYIWFFITYLVHVGFCIWATIAFPFSAEKWSFAGWMTAIAAFDWGDFPGVVYIIGACFWTIEAVYSLWCLKDSYLFFRGRGGVEQVKADEAVAQFQQQQQQQHMGGNNQV